MATLRFRTLTSPFAAVSPITDFPHRPVPATSFFLPIRRARFAASRFRVFRLPIVPCSSRNEAGGAEEGKRDEKEEEEVERALGMDGSIPGSSQEFVRRVSSRAYNMRRDLVETIDSIGYDVLETNPWREEDKPVYVLTQRDNHIWTMKTRRSRSEVEKELDMLFSRKEAKWAPPSGSNKFHMLVEDIREGVLVFEDEIEAVKYCDVLQGEGQGCEGIAEIEASSVFDLCRKIKALAVIFRRGVTPPQPRSLQQNLRAKKRSLED